MMADRSDSSCSEESDAASRVSSEEKTASKPHTPTTAISAGGGADLIMSNSKQASSTGRLLLLSSSSSGRKPRLVGAISKVDVLLGRGKRNQNWPGNELFRQFVRVRSKEYIAPGTNKLVRDEIAREVIHQVYQTGGRFLQEVTEATRTAETCAEPSTSPLRVGDQQTWMIASHSTIRTKTKQALRDLQKRNKEVAARTGSSNKSTLSGGQSSGTDTTGTSNCTTTQGEHPSSVRHHHKQQQQRLQQSSSSALTAACSLSAQQAGVATSSTIPSSISLSTGQHHPLTGERLLSSSARPPSDWPHQAFPNGIAKASDNSNSNVSPLSPPLTGLSSNSAAAAGMALQLPQGMGGLAIASHPLSNGGQHHQNIQSQAFIDNIRRLSEAFSTATAIQQPQGVPQQQQQQQQPQFAFAPGPSPSLFDMTQQHQPSNTSQSSSSSLLQALLAGGMLLQDSRGPTGPVPTLNAQQQHQVLLETIMAQQRQQEAANQQQQQQQQDLLNMLFCIQQQQQQQQSPPALLVPSAASLLFLQQQQQWQDPGGDNNNAAQRLLLLSLLLGSSNNNSNNNINGNANSNNSIGSNNNHRTPTSLP
jgi:hypothetical protein